jgi:hypothetical protein
MSNTSTFETIGVSQRSPFARYSAWVLEPLTASVSEISRLFPDSILFGSLILYVITQNLSYGIFSIFLLETALLHKLVSFLFENTKRQGPRGPPGDSIQCRPGFRMPRLEFERVFMNDHYPSISVLFMGAIASYLALASMSFSETLTSMGADWHTRNLFSYGSIGTLTLIFVLLRWMQCDSISEVFMALVIGLVGGFIFYIANYNLFGVEGMNFMGLPYLQSKTETGSPLYVCVPNTTNA